MGTETGNSGPWLYVYNDKHLEENETVSVGM